MKINFECGYYSKELHIEAENVNMVIDVEERIYKKTPDGKIDTSKPPLRDVSNEAMDHIVRTLSDMVYYRGREYDSTDLIESLFNKLPSEAQLELSKILYEKVN